MEIKKGGKRKRTEKGRERKREGNKKGKTNGNKCSRVRAESTQRSSTCRSLLLHSSLSLRCFDACGAGARQLPRHSYRCLNLLGLLSGPRIDSCQLQSFPEVYPQSESPKCIRKVYPPKLIPQYPKNMSAKVKDEPDEQETISVKEESPETASVKEAPPECKKTFKDAQTQTDNVGAKFQPSKVLFDFVYVLSFCFIIVCVRPMCLRCVAQTIATSSIARFSAMTMTATSEHSFKCVCAAWYRKSCLNLKIAPSLGGYIWVLCISVENCQCCQTSRAQMHPGVVYPAVGRDLDLVNL
jgi:hypothetical protein